MQIVIDLPEQDYELACKYPEVLFGSYGRAIAKGTPLPKEHGRLIDADAFIKIMEDASRRQEYKKLLIDDLLTVDDVFKAVIESLQNKGLAEGDAPTIIAAESEVEE